MTTDTSWDPEAWEAVMASLQELPDVEPFESANEAPYKIVKRDGKFAVVNNAGITKAKFDDRDAAVKYLRALYSNVPGAAKKADKTKWTGKAKPPKS